MSTTLKLTAAEFKKTLGAREGAKTFKALDAKDANPGDGVFDARTYTGNLDTAHAALETAFKAAERMGLPSQAPFAHARDTISEKMIGRGPRRPGRAEAASPVRVEDDGRGNLTVHLKFAEAGKAAKGALQHEVWTNGKVRLMLDKFEPDQIADRADLPPYQIILRASPGESLHYHRIGNGYSTLSDDWGQIINKGSNVFRFYESYEAERADRRMFTVEFKVDDQNDYHYPIRPDTSPESRELKKSWGRFWHPAREDGEGPMGFVLESTAKKKLDFKTPDEMRALPGPAKLIEHFEKDWDGDKIEDHADRFVFAYDPKGKSYAVGEYTEGESDHRLYIFNNRGEFAGFYRVNDTFQREWLEGFQGELGKP